MKPSPRSTRTLLAAAGTVVVLGGSLGVASACDLSFFGGERPATISLAGAPGAEGHGGAVPTASTTSPRAFRAGKGHFPRWGHHRPGTPPTPSTGTPGQSSPSSDPSTSPSTSPEPSTSPSTSPSSSPSTSPSSGSAGLTAQEQAALDRTNSYRASVGCRALVVDPALQATARDHASEMVSQHYFEHTSPSGLTVSARAKKFGYSGSVGENIYVGSSSGTTVIDAFWNEKPGDPTGTGHHDNIANCSYSKVGIGYDPGRPLTQYGPGVWAQVLG